MLNVEFTLNVLSLIIHYFRSLVYRLFFKKPPAKEKTIQNC